MEELDLRRFEEYRENNRLEVKKTQDGLPNSVWESYSSMVNSNGGVILLGVEENADGSFRTTGLQNVTKLKKDFWNTVNNPKKVSINLIMDSDVETHEVNGDVILSIRVPRARWEQKPGIYQRCR